MPSDGLEGSGRVEALKKNNRAAPEQDFTITESLLQALATRSWPGNVRELENACQRLVILAHDGKLREQALLPESVRPRSDDPWPPMPEKGLSLIDLERQVIERALKKKEGNITQAAAYLGVPRHFLVYRIAKYGISRE